MNYTLIARTRGNTYFDTVLFDDIHSPVPYLKSELQLSDKFCSIDEIRKYIEDNNLNIQVIEVEKINPRSGYDY